MAIRNATAPARAQSLLVPAAISGTVTVAAFSAALARAGLAGRYDAARGVLIIERASAIPGRRHPLSELEGAAHALLDPLCWHCGGSGFDGDAACRFCDATGRDVQHSL